MTASTDVVVIGGGAMGGAVAVHLLDDPAFDGRVTLVERDPTFRRASSALSAAGTRRQFSTPENIAMGLFGAAFIKSGAEHLSTDGEQADIPFVEQGYLFLATEAGLPILKSNHEKQRAAGAEIALLDPESLAQRFPWLSTHGLAGGALGLKNEGWTDPYSLLQAFRRKARALGAVFVKDEVVGLERRGARIEAALLADAGRVSCGAFVNAENQEGRTPLHMAAYHGQLEMVRTLLGTGATIDDMDVRGRTALDLATERGHTEIIEALRAAGE